MGKLAMCLFLLTVRLEEPEVLRSSGSMTKKMLRMLWRILTAAPLRAETSVSVSTKEGLEEAEDLGEVAVDEVMVEDMEIVIATEDMTAGIEVMEVGETETGVTVATRGIVTVAVPGLAVIQGDDVIEEMTGPDQDLRSVKWTTTDEMIKFNRATH